MKTIHFFHEWIRNNRVFVAVAIICFIAYLLISITKHYHFNSTGFDLVIFDQAVRNYSDFNAPASTFRGYENLLGDHFHPILVLLAPLYWIVDSLVMLLIAQAVLIVSAGIPVYLFSKSKLGKTPAILLGVAFFLSPILLRAIYFDFHEIAFAIPLIAWSIFLIDRKRFGWMYVPILLLLLVKENLSLLVAFFGIYLLFQRKIKHGAIIFIIGIIWFFLATKVFIPFFAGGNGEFNYWTYSELGADPLSAVLGIITNPLLFLSLLFVPLVKLLTLAKTFVVFLGFTFLSPIIILATPLLLERLLSSNENYWQFNFHYGAVLAPILVMAAADGIYRTRNFRAISKYFKQLKIVLPAIFAGISLAIFAATPMNFIFQPSNYSLTSFERAGHTVLSKIPTDTSVCTTNHIAPHLGRHTLTLIGFDALPHKDLSCDYIVTASPLDQSTALTNTIAKAKAAGFKEIEQNKGWSVYKRGTQ